MSESLYSRSISLYIICNKNVDINVECSSSFHPIFHVKAFYQTTRSLICATYMSFVLAAILPFKCPISIQLFFLLTFPNSWGGLWPLITGMGADDDLHKIFYPKIKPINIQSWITSLQSPLIGALGQVRDQDLLLASREDESFPNFSCLLQHWDLI